MVRVTACYPPSEACTYSHVRIVTRFHCVAAELEAQAAAHEEAMAAMAAKHSALQQAVEVSIVRRCVEVLRVATTQLVVRHLPLLVADG